MNKKSKYAEAGVDFEKEHDVVGVMTKVGIETRKNIKDLEKFGITLPEEGSDFSGGFELDLEMLVNKGVKNMVISGGVDGPGSKPVVHALYNGNDEVKLGCPSICSIAMGANDVLCSGARPFIALEYHSWHKPNVKVARELAVGDLIGAKHAKLAIIGGENASLPQMVTGPYPEKAYDMCHIVYGIILDKELIDNPLGKGRVKEGDAVIGFTSSGVQCNGITLGWKIPIDYKNRGFVEFQKINEKVKELRESVAEALLTPTIIYVDPVLKVLEEYKSGVKAIANITGEGIHNIERVLPEGTGLKLDYSVKEPHPIFTWIQKNGKVSMKEMYEVYNMGTGMVMIADSSSANRIIERLSSLGNEQKLDYQKFSAYKLGEVVKGKGIELKAHDGTKIRY